MPPTCASNASARRLSRLAVGLALLAWLVVTACHRGSAAEVEAAEAARRRDAGAFLLDVREPVEYRQARIPGSILIPLGTLPGRLAEVPKGKPVVIVCATGHRSALGRDALLQAGYSDVTSLRGGMSAWSAAGLPTTSGEVTPGEGSGTAR